MTQRAMTIPRLSRALHVEPALESVNTSVSAR